MTEKSKLLYMTIIDHVKECIKDGTYQPDQKIPTEMEFAEEFGVSRITSRRALIELEKEGIIIRRKGSGSFIAPVEDSTEKSQENTGALNVVAILLPYEYNQGNLMGTVMGASEYLRDRNYFLSIQRCEDEPGAENALLKEITDGKVQGVIYYPLSERTNMEFITTLSMNDFPVVMIDKFFENIPADSVVSDNYLGGYMTAEYLIGLGHERIAFASNESSEKLSSVRDRYLGYCKALRDNGFMIDSSITAINIHAMIKAVDWELYQDVKHLRPILEPEKRAIFKDIIKDFIDKKVTAIQCVNDFTAMYFMRACIDMGIRIPEDMSITGFDNTELSSHLEVPLTTVEQDFHSIGQKAAELLVSNIESPDQETETIVLPVKLVERQSSARANKQAKENAG